MYKYEYMYICIHTYAHAINVQSIAYDNDMCHQGLLIAQILIFLGEEAKIKLENPPVNGGFDGKTGWWLSPSPLKNMRTRRDHEIPN